MARTHQLTHQDPEEETMMIDLIDVVITTADLVVEIAMIDHKEEEIVMIDHKEEVTTMIDPEEVITLIVVPLEEETMVMMTVVNVVHHHPLVMMTVVIVVIATKDVVALTMRTVMVDLATTERDVSVLPDPSSQCQPALHLWPTLVTSTMASKLRTFKTSSSVIARSV